jgi:hypothetical protein
MKKKKTNMAAIWKKSSAPAVTQMLLSEYQELCAYNRRRETLRELIIALLESGASVHPGPLTVTLNVAERLHPTWDKIEAVVGKAGVNAIRSQIEPTSFRMLRLHAGILDYPHWL